MFSGIALFRDLDEIEDWCTCTASLGRNKGVVGA